MVIKPENSVNYADNENEVFINNNDLLSNNENEILEKSANRNFNKEKLDNQIELEREEYLMRKLDEIQDKIIISEDQKIVCAVCYNEVNLELLLNNEECPMCLKNNKHSAEACKRDNATIIKEKFFSNEEKDENSKSQEIECFYSSGSSYASSEEEEIIKESKYKFIIDKDHIDTVRKHKHTNSRNIEEIEEFINKKKWNSGKNNCLINISNIQNPKQTNKIKKDEEYFVNYMKNKFSQNSIAEEENQKKEATAAQNQLQNLKTSKFALI